jgi:starch phosphorylase
LPLVALQTSSLQVNLKKETFMKQPLDNKKKVAYFCTEFGIDSHLPTYSGGLGVLAGDLMSAAADSDFPMIGIGILYKGKEFMQHITGEAKVESRDSEFDHDTSFLRQAVKDGKPLMVTLFLENSEVMVKAYQVRLADNTTLYFLSTDVDGNPPEWVSDMDTLYRGNINGQIRQQILLGVGGVKLLEALGVKPEIYHINEGRAGFIIWEIVLGLMKKQNLSFEDAWKQAREKIVYTNHTLVAAGNPEYPSKIVEKWATPFAKEMNVNTELLIKDGLSDPHTFSITRFALNISSKQSAVSKIHSSYAKKHWPDYNWKVITNGVHMPRWQDSDFRNPSINDRQIWDIHMAKKRELVGTVLQRTGFEYDPNRLIVSWARRLAEYKQPRIIFNDIERLKQILTNSERPVQLLFAGNSHSADPNAKSIIEDIIRIMSTQLSGHAIFVPNYNISLANHLVSGSDVWLNTPKGNLEASGTSGMKAISNGVLNCTVIDGWTHEVDWDGIGWTLDPNNVSNDFYRLMETEIVPMYYQRDRNGLPQEWIQRMKKSINLSSNFSAERMLEEYHKKIYS